LDQSAVLAPLLEGARVTIGFANRLVSDGSGLELAHDAQL
jgi:hypothetical protein